MKAPVCSLNTAQAKEQSVPPTGSQVLQKTAAHYDQLAKEAGVLNTAQQLEINLQKDFISSVSNLASSVPVLGNYNRVESALATLLGWKRWLWQSSSQGFDAGLVRQTLFERSLAASEMIRMIATEKALPDINRLQKNLFSRLPNVSPARVQELLHDQIIVGNYPKLLNVVDSPLVLERLHQRAMKHEANLAEVGITGEAKELLQDLSVRISNTFDETRYAAAQAGFDIDLLGNGGYFPIRATEEFSKYFSKNTEQWLSGFKPLKEIVQKQRRTNMPVVVDVDHMARLLQKQLLGQQLEGKGLAEFSEIEIKAVAEQAAKAKEEAAALQASQVEKLTAIVDKAKAKLEREQRISTNKAEALLKAKDSAKLKKIEGDLKLDKYTAAERKAILAEEAFKLEAKRQDTLAEIVTKWEKKASTTFDNILGKWQKETDALTEAAFKKNSSDVKKFLQHEKAKLALLEVNANPGQLSKFLTSNFSEGQLKRLFEGGYLAQMPAMSDELLEFYRGLDMGVRGLSDAIVLNPVEAIKGYARELSEAAGEQQLFKTAFDNGAEAGWIKADITEAEASSYIKVGANPKLTSYLPNSGLREEVADMWIHKTAADQLDALLKINTSPSELNHAAQAFQMFTSFTRKSLIVGGLDGYVKRVFVQNLISLYASTGSLAQLPLAVVDVLRHMSGQWNVGSDTAKVFTVGQQAYTVGELLREVAVRRGNYATASMNDSRNVAESFFSSYTKEAQERARHFNSLYTAKFGNPITAKVGEVAGVAGSLFDKAYGLMSLSNALLDNAARWAAVRELASSGKYDNLDTLLRDLDNYFSINADAGAVGSFLGNTYMPFAQFAINAPGAALRHALNHPWRTANMMHLYSQASATTDITEAETPPWLRESEGYFFSAYRDPETGKHGIVMPQGVDFMLDSYTWMTSLARDLAGDPMTVTGYVTEKNNPAAKVQKTFADILSKNYLANSVLALIGINPQSLEAYDKNAPADTLLGVPMSVGTRTMLTNLLPVLRKLDRSLPTSVVGRAPASDTLFGSVKYTKDAGQPGLFGAVPTTGGTRADKQMPAVARTFEALTGISVIEVDPQQNIISTYKDFNSQITSIRRNRLALYRKLVQANISPRSSEYQRLDELKHLEVVLVSNKARIDRLAVRKGMTPPMLYESLQGNFDEVFNAPLENDVELEIMQTLNQENTP